jgi:hypothetical protein
VASYRGGRVLNLHTHTLFWAVRGRRGEPPPTGGLSGPPDKRVKSAAELAALTKPSAFLAQRLGLPQVRPARGPFPVCAHIHTCAHTHAPPTKYTALRILFHHRACPRTNLHSHDTTYSNCCTRRASSFSGSCCAFPASTPLSVATAGAGPSRRGGGRSRVGF